MTAPPVRLTWTPEQSPWVNEWRPVVAAGVEFIVESDGQRL